MTRPQADAARWVQALGTHGIDALALPLIEIRALSDTSAVAAAWARADQCQAIMFVSASAVDHFFAARPPQAGVGTSRHGPRLWAPGPGTVAALQRHGVAPERIDAPAPDSAQYDSEALWRLVGAGVQPGRVVMIVRGAGRDVSLPNAAPTHDGALASERDTHGEGRDWLAQQLAQSGALVHFVVAYWRAAPGAQALRQALAEQRVGDDALWLFTSAQAIGNLRACLPQHDWSRARAVASHARIAAAARAAGFGVVRESRPALPDLAASIKSAS